jgi:hypothetical protein
MKRILSIFLILIACSCSTVELISTPTMNRKAIIQGDEVTIVTEIKISLDQYNEIKKNSVVITQK